MKAPFTGALFSAALLLAASAAAQDTTSAAGASIYTRDPAGRIETVTTDLGTTRYSYFDDGEISEIVHSDGSRETYDHNEIVAAHRLVDRLVAEDAQVTDGPTASLSASTDPFDVSANRIAFTGYYFDREIGLYFAKARYYDPALGRFTSQDTFLGRSDNPPSLNRYLYAAARPTFFVDPSGHDDKSANRLARALAPTLVPINAGANDVAAPITQRLEGALSLVVPGGLAYWTGSNSESSYTRNVQRALLDEARDSNNSVATRVAAGASAVLQQPGALLNDVAHAVVGVPGRLAGAGGHLLDAVRAEDSVAARLAALEAVKETAEAGETMIGAVIFVRSAAPASVVEEGRVAGQERLVPAVGKIDPEQPLGSSASSGPVTFRLPPNATPEQIAQARAYCQMCNDALEAQQLSPTGRVSTKGQLRREATRAAAVEKARAAAAGEPYQGHPGHVPDTTWTGNPVPPRWLDLDPIVNTSLGGQAPKYPVGFKPTRFILEEPR